ncbi:MAG: DUF3048 domain-containing protein [Firmicutes bacterium]|nr:DUF3048 domain-containing protein [Bacillota bacterium]
MGKKDKKQKAADNKKGKRKLLIIILVILAVLITGGGLLAAKHMGNSNNTAANTIAENVQNDTEITVTVPKINIFNGDSRPIAVVLENSTNNDWPQPGLQDAYLVYEITVEGGMTKLMALYKGKDVSDIGYVRSVRPAFIDYALANDAVLVHYGHSPAAASDEASMKVDYINGINLLPSDKTFWTVKGYTTGNAKRMVTSIKNIQAKMKNGNIRTTSADTGLGYVAGDYDLENVTDEAGNITNTANSVNITYSTSHTVSYTYDANTKLYKRFQRGAPHLAADGMQLTAKNIIVLLADEFPLAGEYVQINTVGTGTGYYLTNGKYIEITWKKDSRTAKVQYFDKTGNEIKMNDGVTYIQVTPKGQKVIFK